MDNETEELVNRALYKQIKSMNRAEMETFVRNVFALLRAIREPRKKRTPLIMTAYEPI